MHIQLINKVIEHINKSTSISEYYTPRTTNNVGYITYIVDNNLRLESWCGFYKIIFNDVELKTIDKEEGADAIRVALDNHKTKAKELELDKFLNN